MKYPPLILLGLVLNQCSSPNPETTIPTIRVNADQAEMLTYSEIFQRIQYLPLETHDSVLVGDVSKVIVHQNQFYLTSGNSLFVFNGDGKVVFTLQAEGQGPEEYTGLTDFYVNANGSIEILDNRERKIIRYDRDGNFERAWNIDFSSQTFVKARDSSYLFFCGNTLNGDLKSQLVYMTDPESVPQGLLPINEMQAKFLQIINSNALTKEDDDVLLASTQSDTVYSIEDVPSPRYVIDFGSTKVPNETRYGNHANIMEFSNVVTQNNYSFFLHSFFSTDSYIFFAFRHGANLMHAYYNKTTGETITVNRITDDVILGQEQDVTFEMSPVGHSGNTLISVTQPVDFMEQITGIKNELSATEWATFQNYHPEIIDLYNELTITDNPILVLATLKQE